MTITKIDTSAVGASGTHRLTGPNVTVSRAREVCTPLTMRHHAHASKSPVAPAARIARGHTGLSAIAAGPAVSTPKVARIQPDVRSGGRARHHPTRAAPWCTTTRVAIAGGTAAKNNHEMGMIASAKSSTVQGTSATTATAVKPSARRDADTRDRSTPARAGAARGREARGPAPPPPPPPPATPPPLPLWASE